MTKTKTDPATDLRAKIADLDTKRLMLMGERDQLSYDAVVERNGAAAKRVAELNTELSRLADDKATLNAALAEAGRREAAAAAEKRDTEERDNAEKALALLDEFAKNGAELEQAANAVIAKFNALSKKSRELTALGYAPATLALVDSNMKLALKTKLMGTGLIIEHLAPHMRRTFISVIESWTSHVRARAMARLNRNKSAKAA
jgi:hypothetical protein